MFLLRIIILCAWLGSGTLLLTAVENRVDEDDERSSPEVHFALEVLPILDQKCFPCHDPARGDAKGELDLTSIESMMAGGESGEPALERGNPTGSLIVQAIRWDGLEMPPKENDRLGAKQIEAFEKWIESGAVWPDKQRLDQIQSDAWERRGSRGVRVATSGGLSEDWTNRTYDADDVWAFAALEIPAEPSGGYRVDAFVDARLREAGVKPAPRAEPRELIRRATYDLTGLPPTPEELDEFEIAYANDGDAAWHDLIERLLDSVHYGERWAQHWLDVVRYADTAGLSNDYELSNAWRYRDYVIRAFNNDLPYNEFVIQQIAGDELYEQLSQGEESSDSSLSLAEARIATGFLRMGPWEHTAMTPDKVSRQNYLDDLVNGIGQTFLSTPLRCCKCHDHKFDPIPTRDYYRVYAALSQTQPAEMPAEFLDFENRRMFESQRAHVERLLDFASEKVKMLSDKREVAARKWYEERGIADKYLPWDIRKQRDVKGRKPPRAIGLTPQEEGRLKVREQDVRIWKRRLERFQPLAQSVYNGPVRLQKSDKLRQPKVETVDIVREKNFIYAGGDVFTKSDAVTPGVLSCTGVASSRDPQDPYSLTHAMSGRRLQLARWIANDKNSLATRSIVNRIWHYHFGRGIAANPNNLGATGAKPTHQDLLDWLASEFVAEGWSIKQLHRTIMRSETYMRSTSHPHYEALENVDPTNRLLAVFLPRRLTAEEYRDTLLAASGELNRETGGLPIRPEINTEVAFSPRMIQFSLAPAYQSERLAADRNRRSIYAYRVRGLRNPLLEVLDQPNPNESCELRDSASTAPQVFATMNGDYATKRSIAMAMKLEAEFNDVESRIRYGFLSATGQKISDELGKKLLKHCEKMLAYHEKKHPQDKVYPTSITRSLVEENTGETFFYEELLDNYQDYEPDKGPSDVDPETRALADICLLIFNSNQLMYVY